MNLKKLEAISRGTRRLGKEREIIVFVTWIANGEGLTFTNPDLHHRQSSCVGLVTKKKQAYSPYLLISSLPPTVMPDDIRRMAVAEGSITDIIYHRNKYMEFQNRITVVFRSSTDAVEFIAQKYGKFLGGHKLNMNMVRGHTIWPCGTTIALTHGAILLTLSDISFDSTSWTHTTQGTNV
jgi:hypothetical protein